MSDVTRILNEIADGKRQASADLFPLVYDELKRIASIYLARENDPQTLQPTALVHEAFLRLVVPEQQRDWTTVNHFMAVSAEVMRHILVDNARRKRRIKRGGQMDRAYIDLQNVSAPVDDLELIALDEALKKLAEQDPVKAKLIVLRYFGGMTIEQACEVLEISRTTAHRHWTYARAWLYGQVKCTDLDKPDS